MISVKQGILISVGNFATQWRRRFRPHKVYTIWIRITSQIYVAMSVKLGLKKNYIKYIYSWPASLGVRPSVRFYAS